jgi:hypothetical protein
MKLLIILPFLGLIIFGCSNSNDTSSASTQRGSLSGHVIVYDTLPFPQLGVTVSLFSTNFKTETDSAGFWTINDIPAGTYTVLYSKEGFGTLKNIAFQFNGNGEVFTPTVYFSRQLTNTFIIADPIASNNYFGINVRNSLNKFESLYIVVIGSDSVLKYDDNHNLISLVSVDETPRDSNFKSHYMPLPSGRFYSGKKYYVCVYARGGDAGSYYDPETDQIIYVNVGPKSNTLSFIIP